MIKIISEKLPRILKARKRLEKELKVKITNRGKEVYINGTPEREFVAEKVIEAIDFGFIVPVALLIKEENFLFEIVNIKKFTRSKNMEIVRGRMIGKEGKTKKTLCQLTDCFFEINNNDVGIIGPAENMKCAEEAVIALSRGAKQSNVYAFLEKNHPKPIIDLGLKE
jgi:ribosomal RNA assembly protein